MWRVLGVLGHGGHGTVFLVEHSGEGGLQRRMALKVLGPAGERAAQRLRDEARILALVRHRAVARAEALVKVEGRWAMLLEYVEGASLRDALLVGSLPPAAALEVAAEIARALDGAWHASGPAGEPLHVLHRDLKPSNVQLTPRGEVKLLDFGIARAALAGRADTTEGVAGTPGYVPPERLEGAEEGPAGDVFALGVLLAEMLTGQPVRQFPLGEARHESHLRAVLARLPVGEALLRSMLAREPGERPSARDAERELEALRRAATGPSLRDWAESTVPGLVPSSAEGDPWVGTTLTLDTGTGEVSSSLPSVTGGRATGRVTGAEASARDRVAPPGRRAWAYLAAGLGLAVLVALLSWPPGEPVPDGTQASGPQVAAGELAVDAVPSAPASAPAADPMVPAPAGRSSVTPVPGGSVGISPEASASSPPSSRRPDPSAAVVVPSSPAVAETGRVVVNGDAETVRLVDSAGHAHAQLDALAPGTYSVRVRFSGLGEGPGGTVTVVAGTSTVLECSSITLECRAR